jgi:transcriptional regulator with XRE-family HTH domain
VIYDKVIEYCEKNKLSIAAFEKKCGIGNGTIGRWENNSSLPTMSTLQKMEIATKIPIRKWVE